MNAVDNRRYLLHFHTQSRFYKTAPYLRSHVNPLIMRNSTEYSPSSSLKRIRDGSNHEYRRETMTTFVPCQCRFSTSRTDIENICYLIECGQRLTIHTFVESVRIDNQNLRMDVLQNRLHVSKLWIKMFNIISTTQRKMRKCL